MNERWQATVRRGVAGTAIGAACWLTGARANALNGTRSMSAAHIPVIGTLLLVGAVSLLVCAVFSAAGRYYGMVRTATIAIESVVGATAIAAISLIGLLGSGALFSWMTPLRRAVSVSAGPALWLVVVLAVVGALLEFAPVAAFGTGLTSRSNAARIAVTATAILCGATRDMAWIRVTAVSGGIDVTGNHLPVIGVASFLALITMFAGAVWLWVSDRLLPCLVVIAGAWAQTTLAAVTIVAGSVAHSAVLFVVDATGAPATGAAASPLGATTLAWIAGMAVIAATLWSAGMRPGISRMG